MKKKAYNLLLITLEVARVAKIELNAYVQASDERQTTWKEKHADGSLIGTGFDVFEGASAKTIKTNDLTNKLREAEIKLDQITMEAQNIDKKTKW